MDNTTNSTTNGTSDGFQSNATPKNFWSGLLLPIIYLTILIGSFATFTSLYRKRQVTKAAKLEGWFPPHRQRDIYLSLLHLDPTESNEKVENEKKLSRVPDSVLKAALLNRASEDIRRLILLRAAKPAIQVLIQRGSVGDELWQRFQRAEHEMEEEIKDVVNEANAFAPNWGQIIFQSANEMNQNRLIKEKITELQEQVESEKAWWESKRAGIQSEFMKELESDSNTTATTQRKPTSDDEAVLVEADGPAQAQGGAKKAGKK